MENPIEVKPEILEESGSVTEQYSFSSDIQEQSADDPLDPGRIDAKNFYKLKQQLADLKKLFKSL
jgi:hypothetical protein